MKKPKKKLKIVSPPETPEEEDVDFETVPRGLRKNDGRIGRPRARRRHMTPGMMRFVERYFLHGNATRAYREAGYTGVHAIRMLNHPLVVEKIKQFGAKMAEKVKYNQEQLTDEINDAILFAKATKNANALVKAIELKGKAYGLIIDKHDVRALGSFSINIVGIAPSPNAALPGPAVVENALPPASNSELTTQTHELADAVTNRAVIDAVVLSKKEDDDEDEIEDPFSLDS